MVDFYLGTVEGQFGIPQTPYISLDASTGRNNVRLRNKVNHFLKSFEAYC